MNNREYRYKHAKNSSEDSAYATESKGEEAKESSQRKALINTLRSGTVFTSILDVVVVFLAQLVPLLGHWVLSLGVSWVLSKHNTHTHIQMPIEMAVKEPGARVVGTESNDSFIVLQAGGDGVPLHGVVEVILGGTGSFDDIEVVAVKMERMRSTALSASTFDTDLDHLVARESVDRASGQKILSRIVTAHDLQQDGNLGSSEGSIVDTEETVLGGVKSADEGDVDISIADCGIARGSLLLHRNEFALVEDDLVLGYLLVSWKTREFVGGVGVAKDGNVGVVLPVRDCVSSTSLSTDLVFDRETLWLSTNPVRIRSLVAGVQNMGVPLASINGHGIDLVRLGQNRIGLDDSELVSIDGVVESCIASHLNDTHTVLLARFDLNDGQIIQTSNRIVREDTFAVDDNTVGDSRARERPRMERFPISMEPVTQADDLVIRINIITVRLLIRSIVTDDQRTTKTITVLGREMGVVPECSCLWGSTSGSIPSILERIVWDDRALSYSGRTVGPVGVVHVNTVPVDTSHFVHVVADEVVGNSDLEAIALITLDDGSRKLSVYYSSLSSEAISSNILVLDVYSSRDESTESCLHEGSED
jgi:hypothetical protein